MKRGFDMKEWRKAIQALRTLHPPIYPVKVRRVPLKSTLADVGLIKKGSERFFLIRIDKASTELSLDFGLMLLTHEWSHVIVWPLYLERYRDHNPHFGIAWNDTYTTVYHNAD